MSDILTAISALVTGAIDWISMFITNITGNPIIMIFVIVAFVGLGVGLLSRLMHL